MPRRPIKDPKALACLQFFDRMDQAVDSAGVTDAGVARIEGFPFLRVNRFLASLTADPLGDAAFAAWVERLRRLDAATRKLEFANLPPEQKKPLYARIPSHKTLESFIDECGKQLAQPVTASEEQRSALLAKAIVPDAYLTWERVLGLYPITRLAAAVGIERLHRRLGASFELSPEEIPIKGALFRYRPPTASRLTERRIQHILKSSSDNPLGLPEPDAEQLDALFAAFAPLWEIDVVTDSDRIGAIKLDGRGHPQVDTASPVVYRLVSHARFDRKLLLQLNYLIWLPSRPKKGWLDLYAGPLDGLIWRVTLDQNGQPLAYDSIHPCGCYYILFPGEGYRSRPPEDGAEPVLSPKSIAPIAHDQRLVIRLAHRTHYIRQIYPAKASAEGIVYRWKPYDELRALPMPGGGHRSLFDERGLIGASERLERFLFWPMGVPSAGAMRQWGTHAIAFLGRRHFDDPWLLDKLLRPEEIGDADGS